VPEYFIACITRIQGNDEVYLPQKEYGIYNLQQGSFLFERINRHSLNTPGKFEFHDDSNQIFSLFIKIKKSPEW